MVTWKADPNETKLPSKTLPQLQGYFEPVWSDLLGPNSKDGEGVGREAA